MNARDLFEMIAPALNNAKGKATPLLSFGFDQAKEQHAKAGPVTRVFSGFVAGTLAGKVVSTLAR
jgi:hypothetical protein